MGVAKNRTKYRCNEQDTFLHLRFASVLIPRDLFISRVDIIHWKMSYFSVLFIEKPARKKLFLRYELGIVRRHTQTTRSQCREHSIIDFPRSISPVNLSLVSFLLSFPLSFTAIVSLETLKTIGRDYYRADTH